MYRLPNHLTCLEHFIDVNLPLLPWPWPAVMLDSVRVTHRTFVFELTMAMAHTKVNPFDLPYGYEVYLPVSRGKAPHNSIMRVALLFRENSRNVTESVWLVARPLPTYSHPSSSLQGSYGLIDEDHGFHGKSREKPRYPHPGQRIIRHKYHWIMDRSDVWRSLPTSLILSCFNVLSLTVVSQLALGEKLLFMISLLDGRLPGLTDQPRCIMDTWLSLWVMTTAFCFIVSAREGREG